jgi:hypothetical protein
MPHLPVRPCHLGQRRPLVTFLPSRPAAGLLPQRPFPRRWLVQPLTRRRPGGVPRRLGQPGLQLGDPLPRRRQLGPRPLQFASDPGQGGLRAGQLAAQRHHKTCEHLIRRRALVSGHGGTLRPKITRCTHPVTAGVSTQRGSLC